MANNGLAQYYADLNKQSNNDGHKNGLDQYYLQQDFAKYQNKLNSYNANPTVEQAKKLLNELGRYKGLFGEKSYNQLSDYLSSSIKQIPLNNFSNNYKSWVNEINNTNDMELVKKRTAELAKQLETIKNDISYEDYIALRDEFVNTQTRARKRSDAVDGINAAAKGKMATDSATSLDLLELLQLEQQGVKADKDVVSDMQKHLLGQETSNPLYTQMSSLVPDLQNELNGIVATKNAIAKLEEENETLTLAAAKGDDDASEKIKENNKKIKLWKNAIKEAEAKYGTESEIRAKLSNWKTKYGDVIALKQLEIDKNNFQKILQMSSQEIKEIWDSSESPIAYTTPDGQNITWQRLYDTAVYDEDVEAKISQFSANADWEEKSKVMGNATTYAEDYEIVFELSRTRMPRDWKYAQQDGYSKEEYDDIESKRKYIEDKYGVELNIYDDIKILNDLINKLTYLKTQNDSESKIFSYIWATEGSQAAYEWFNTRTELYEERHRVFVMKQSAKFGKEHPIFSTALQAASFPLVSAMQIINYVDYAKTGELDYNYAALGIDSAKQGVMENADWNIAGFDVFDFLYSTGVSGAQSYIASGFPIIGEVALGLNAAASAQNAALDRGMSSGKAFFTGFVAGVAEAVFEHFSLGALRSLKSVPPSTWKDISFNTLKSLGVNASEEAATEFANLAYDYAANSDFSQYKTNVRMYESQGYTTEDAEDMAHKQNIYQIVEAAGSGALMGFGFGVINNAKPSSHNITSSRYINSVGNTLIKNNQVERLIELAETSGIDISAYNLEGKKGNYNAKAIGELYFELMRNKSDAVSNALKEMGVSEADVAVVQSAVFREAFGQELSTEMQAKYNQYKDVIDNAMNDEASSLNVAANDYMLTSLLVEIARSKASNTATDVSGTDSVNADFDTNIDTDIDTEVNVESSSDIDATAESEIAEADYLDNETLESVEENEYDKTIRLMDGRAKPLTEAQAYVQSVGRALGYTVVIDDLSRGGRTASGKSFKGTTRGFFDGQTIYLHEGQTTFDAVVKIFKHEITHYSELNPKMYEKYAKAVFGSEVFENWISGKAKGRSHPARLGQYRQSIIDIYEANGKTLDPTAADREIIANFTSEMLFNEKGNTLERFINEVNSEDRNAISQFIHDFISWLKARLKGEKVSLKIVKLENRFAAVLRNVDNTNAQKNNTTNDGDVQNLSADKSVGYYSSQEQNIERTNAGLDDSAFSMPENDDKTNHSFEITPEQDAEYLDAVNNGDMETAQRMVDEAAKKAGYSIRAYHGTPNGNFTKFDTNKIASTTDAGIFGRGFYFTTHKETADVYATENGKTMPVYLQSNNPWWAVAHRNIQEVSEKLGMEESALTLRGYGGKGRIVTPTMSQSGQFSAHLQEHGYDSVIVQHGKNNYEIVVFDSNAIKSADPVTYDDNGNVIPLSERFNEDDNDIRYSFDITPEQDAEYLDAVNNGDMETAQRMVDEVAIKRGFDVDEDGRPDLLFHGTDSFGFTKLDTSQSDDDISFWATPNMGVAGSYYEGSNYRIRRIGKEKIVPKVKKLDYYSSAEQAVNAARSLPNGNNQDLSKAKYVKESEVMKKARKYLNEVTLAAEDVLNGGHSKDIKRIAERVIAASNQGTYGAWQKVINHDSWQRALDVAGISFEAITNAYDTLNDKSSPSKSDISKVATVNSDVFKMMYSFGQVLDNINSDDVVTIRGETAFKSEIIDRYNSEIAEKGIYGFYHKQNNPFIYDCLDSKWNKIPVPNEAKGYFDVETVTTRELAKWAFENGYDSIKFDNVIDVGGYALSEARYPATIWAFKNPEAQLKSADPVTYDNKGKVIPLSQRFNEDNDDVRYSFEDDVVDKTSSLAERVRLGEISQTEYLNELQQLMNEATEKYGAIPKGENPKVDVTVPKQVSDKRNTRRFVRTVLESGTLTDEMVADTDEAILKDALSYVPISNEEAIKVAAKSLKNGTAERDWNKVANGDKIPSKHDIAKGEILLKMYAENGDACKVMELVADLSEVATRAGQTVQAFSLLKKMSGVGQLYYIQKTVDKLNRDLEKKHKGKHEQIAIDETLAGQLVTAKPGTETENIADEIMQDIAEQVPVTFLDKWNAWRYLAMLGNPRTHIRNLFGNAVFMPAIKLKDTIKAGMEKAFVSQENRTTSVIVNKEYKDFAKSDFEKVADIITGNGKMNPSDAIREQQKIFKNKVLEGFRKSNFDALEEEDMIFLKMHYKRALGGFLQARNIDLNNVDEATLNEARNYAIEEAQKATYRDTSAFANTISRFSRSNKTANLLIEGILPFKKTPINIVKRGVEYSPAGLIKTLIKGTYDLKKGNITASQYIDGISSGLTGTGIFISGCILSSLGVAVGGLGYDDEDALKRLNGEQEYSIELFGKSYTVDWMAPACIPFFMGVEFTNMFDDDEKSFLPAFVDAAYGSLEPMINLSMLNGIRDTIAAARYSDAEDVLTQVGGETISSYFSQALPTLFGQVARTFDDTRRSNFVPGDATGFEKKLYEFFQNAMGKTPILENQKMPYTDAFGEKDTNDNFFLRVFENMLSPGYSSTIKETDVNAELADLFKQTGDGAVIPRKASKSFTVGGERIYLDADQYTQYNTKKGQLSQNMLVDLFNSKGYKSMTYTKKAEAVSEVYKYANALAKTEVSDYQLEGKYAKWKEYQGYGYDVSELIALDIADKDFDGSGGVSKSEYAEAVNNTDMSQKQKDLLIGLNEVEGKSDYSKNKTKGFGTGDWYYKENGQYVKITSAAELNRLRRNNVDTYVYTGNYTDVIDELWRAYRGY